MWTLLTLPSLMITAFLMFGMYRSQQTQTDFFDFHNVTLPSNESMPLYPDQVEFNVTELIEEELERDMQEGEQAKIIMQMIKNMTEAA